MNKIGIILLLLCSFDIFGSTLKLEKIICDSFNEKLTKARYEKSFSSSFRKEFSYESNVKFFSNIVDDYGNCKSSSIEKVQEGKALVTINTDAFKNFFTIVHKNNEITGMWTSGVETLSGVIEEKANYICSLIQKDFKLDYKKNFEKSFTDAIPESQIIAIFKNIYETQGSCKKIKAYPRANDSAVLISENNNNLIFNLSVNIDSKKIVGLLYKGVEQDPIVINSEKDIKDFLSKTPGLSTMSYRSESENIFTFNKNEKMALGSTFKLFILLTLQDKISNGEYKWSDLLTIEDRFKSLPSGEMQNIPAGEKRPIFEFAKKMIRISDNTATDHLLNLVTKESVEKRMKESGIKHSENIPFLSTMEMFRTRAFFNKEDVKKYNNSNRVERMAILNELSTRPYEDFISQISKWGNTPKHIRDIEWFSNSDEICSLLFDLKNTNSKEVLDILSFNAPVIDKSNIEYAGYKGGSEPGVIYMAYLLKKKSDKKWYCFLSGVNDNSAPVDQDKFFEFIKGSSKYLFK